MGKQFWKSILARSMALTLAACLAIPGTALAAAAAGTGESAVLEDVQRNEEQSQDDVVVTDVGQDEDSAALESTDAEGDAEGDSAPDQAETANDKSVNDDIDASNGVTGKEGIGEDFWDHTEEGPVQAGMGEQDDSSQIIMDEENEGLYEDAERTGHEETAIDPMDVESSETIFHEEGITEDVSDSAMGDQADQEASEWIEYPSGILRFEEDYQGKTGEPVAITATWISEAAPDRFSWSSSDPYAVFSGTSFVPPEITGEKNTWWVSVLVTHERKGDYIVQAVVNGKTASARLSIEQKESEEAQNEWHYLCGELQEINNGHRPSLKIGGTQYEMTDAYSNQDANSAINALIDPDTNLVVASLRNGKIYHLRHLKEVAEPVVEVKLPQEGICWSGGKFLQDTVKARVIVRLRTKQDSIFGETVLKMVGPKVWLQYLKLETDSDLLHFEKTGLLDSGKCYEHKDFSTVGSSMEGTCSCSIDVNLIMNQKKAPSAAAQEVVIRASVRTDKLGTVQCEDTSITVGNADLQIQEKAQSDRNIRYDRACQDLQKKLGKTNRTSIITLDNLLYDYFTKDQVTEIRDFLSVYMSEILEADKVGDLACFSWMPSKVREKVKGKIFGKLGVKEKTFPTYKSGEADVSVEGETLQGDTKRVDFHITYSEYAMGYTSNPYGAHGHIEYTVADTGKEGIGDVCFANLNAFRNTLMDFIEIAYDQAWGKSADSVASMFVSTPINKLLQGKYSSRLYKLMKENAENSVKKVSFHCPVDVFVYNSDGELCGSVENDAITKMDGIYINSYPNPYDSDAGAEKDIYLGGDDFTIRVTGRKSGTMAYGVTEYDGGETVCQYEKERIPVAYMKTYECFIPDDIGTDPDVYALDGGYGEIIPIIDRKDEKEEDIQYSKHLGKTDSDDIQFTYDPNTHTGVLGGTGAMADMQFGLCSAYPEMRTLIVEDGVTYIGDNAFRGQIVWDADPEDRYADVYENYGAIYKATNLTTVEIGDGVAEIGDRAFAGQSNLSSISLGKSLKEVWGNDFLGCTNLWNIYADPDSPYLKSGSDQRLYSKDGKVLYLLPAGTKSYTGPEGLEKVWGFAAADISTLESVTLPKTVTVLGRGCFWGCENLSCVRLLSDEITTKEYGSYVGCFAGCNRMESLGRTGGGYDFEFSMECLDYGIVEGMEGLRTAIFGDGTREIYGKLSCQNLSYLFIGETVEHVGSELFAGCPLLETAGPAGGGYDVEFAWKDFIPSYAFCGEDMLKQVVIPEGVVSVGTRFLNRCSNLERLVLPASLESIVVPEPEDDDDPVENGYIFVDCPKLTSVGPVGGDYNVEIAWKDRIPDNLFRFSKIGTFVFPESIKEVLPATFLGSSVNKVVFPGDLESIGERAFCACKELRELEWSGKLKSIGRKAFYGCSGLEKIELPESLDVVCEEAFRECRHLKKAVFPRTMEEIGEYAFCRCDALEEAAMPDSLQSLRGHAFEECSTLKSIMLPNDLEKLEEGTFDSCSSLSEVQGMDRLRNPEVIERDTFHNCASLKEFTILEGVKEVRTGAFRNCSALEKITFPRSLEDIAVGAFDKCDALKDIYYQGTEDEWENVYVHYYSNYPLQTAEEHFLGSALSITGADVSPISSVVYSRLPNKPDPVIKVGSEVLRKGIDYDIDYKDNVNAGTATVMITGKAKYEGTITRTFSILKAEQKINAVFTPSTISVGGLTESVKLTGSMHARAVFTSLNPSIAQIVGSGTVMGVKPGTATIMVALPETDNYNEASTKVSITVAPLSMTGASVTGIKGLTWTGRPLSPAPTVKIGSKTLKKGTDYTVSYKNNKNVGTATMTITGKGSYAGSIRKTFTINPKGTTLSKVSAGKKAFTANWRKQNKQTTGYQIQYSLKKNFASGNKTKTISKASTTKQKISGLKKGKTYYVRIRTYRKVGKKTYYSGWSKAKSVKVK